jgi:hypothetical protein
MAKLRRARQHVDSFHKTWEESIKANPYKFSCEIHAGGREHVYKLDPPPAIDDRIPLIIGDAIHNFRAALDYLAAELVRLNGKEPTLRTAYPMKPRKHVSGGVPRKARRIINEVYGLDDGQMPKWLGLLRDLDNIDKHRHLPVVGAIPNNATLSVEFLGPGETTNIDSGKSKLFSVTLDKHGKVVAKIVYLSPVSDPDPNFSVEPVVVFGRQRMPKRVRLTPVPSVLWRFVGLLEFEAMPLFAPLFS